MLSLWGKSVRFWELKATGGTRGRCLSRRRDGSQMVCLFYLISSSCIYTLLNVYKKRKDFSYSMISKYQVPCWFFVKEILIFIYLQGLLSAMMKRIPLLCGWVVFWFDQYNRQQTVANSDDGDFIGNVIMLEETLL